MKQLLLLTAYALLHLSAYSQHADLSYIPYRQGDKWGYCSPDKKIVVQPKFDEANVFYGPLTGAKIDSQYCVINRKGDVLYKSKGYCGTTADGTHYITGPKYGEEQMFDATGKAVTKVYYKIESFNQYGYSRVTSDYVKMGLMDRTYKEVITPAYGSIEFLNKDVIRVFNSKTYKFALVHIPSKQQISGWYGQIYDAKEGLIMVTDNGKCGFIDINGKEIIPLQYTKEVPVSERRDGNFNESTYEDFNYDGFYEGLAVVVKDEKAGYINKQGKEVIPFVYDKAFGFRNGRAWVRQNGQWGMIDKKGKVVLPIEQKHPNYLYAKELEALDGYHEGMIAIQKDTLWGYADTTGKIVIAPKYSRAMPFYESMAAVYEGEKMGFINKAGKYVIPPVYKWAQGVGEWNKEPFYDNRAVAMLPEDNWVLIDKKGKRLLPHQFDGNNSISFIGDVAYGTSDDVVYVFNTQGKILHTFPMGHSVYGYSKNLFYDYTEKCFTDIDKKIKYCTD